MHGSPAHTEPRDVTRHDANHDLIAPNNPDNRHYHRRMTQPIIILAFALAIWFWLDSMRARETAVAACEKTCRHLGVQFLDETVALSRLRLRRNALGQLQLHRTYRFEFTESGTSRHRGTVALLGRHIEELHLERPDQIYPRAADRLE